MRRFAWGVLALLGLLLAVDRLRVVPGEVASWHWELLRPVYYGLLALAVLVDREVREACARAVPREVLALVVLAVGSMAWSGLPARTGHFALVLAGSTLLGVVLGAHFSPRRVLELLGGILLVVVVGSLALAEFAPALGRAGEAYAHAVTGIFDHPHGMARHATLGALVFAVLARRAATRWGFRGALAAAAICLLPMREIQHHTAWVALLAVLLAWLVVDASRRFRRGVAAVVAVGVVVLALTIARDPAGMMLRIGKDATLTGRTTLWVEVVPRVLEARPLLGYGYEAFWGLGSPGVLLHGEIGFPAAHAHNGAVDVLLALGLVGLALLAAALIRGGIDLWRTWPEELDLGWDWSLGLLVYCLTYDMSDTILMAPSRLFWVLTVCVLAGLRRRARPEAGAGRAVRVLGGILLVAVVVHGAFHAAGRERFERWSERAALHHSELARWNQREARFPQALAEARRASQYLPDWGYSRRLEAYALRKLGRMEESDRVAEAGLAAAPFSPDIRIEWALRLEERGEVAAALRFLDAARALTDDRPELLEVRARLLASVGRMEEAATDLLRSFEVPGVEPRRSLFRLIQGPLASADRVDDARWLVERVEEARPGAWWVAEARAEVATRAGDATAAAAAREASRALAPAAQLEASRRLWGAGDLQGAEDALELACRESPGWWVPRMNLGLLRAQRGRAEQAEADMQKAVELDPTGEAHAWRGGARVRRGDTGGRGDLEHALILGHHSFELYRDLAVAWAQEAVADRVLRFTRRCLELDRARTAASITTIAAPFFEKRERMRAGIEYFTALEELFPEAWWVPENIARLAAGLGEIEVRRAAEARARAKRGG